MQQCLVAHGWGPRSYSPWETQDRPDPKPGPTSWKHCGGSHPIPGAPCLSGQSLSIPGARADPTRTPVPTRTLFLTKQRNCAGIFFGGRCMWSFSCLGQQFLFLVAERSLPIKTMSQPIPFFCLTHTPFSGASSMRGQSLVATADRSAPTGAIFAR